MQLLTGDRADNIQGLKGIGPKKAENILAGTAFGKRRQAVIGAYREHYGQEWETELQLTGDLIFIRGVKDERFKI
jgi:5'-3' exonuclease